METTALPSISTTPYLLPYHSLSSTRGTGTILSSGMTGTGTDGAGDGGIPGIMTLGIPDGAPIIPGPGIPDLITPDAGLITPATGRITLTGPIIPEVGLSYRDAPPAVQAERGGTCHHPVHHCNTAVLPDMEVHTEAADILAVTTVAANPQAPVAALQAALLTGAEVPPPAEVAAESVPVAGEEAAEE